MKKSFVLYNDQSEVINALTDKQAGQLLKAFYAFQNKELVKLDPILNLLFLTFKQTFIRDSKKYEDMSEMRSKFGRQGGIKSAEKRWGFNESKQNFNVSKGKQNKQKLKSVSKITVSDSVSDNNITTTKNSFASDKETYSSQENKKIDGIDLLIKHGK